MVPFRAYPSDLTLLLLIASRFKIYLCRLRLGGLHVSKDMSLMFDP